ncbi:AraC family transcriptional regulator [Burkholderia sp. Ac-20353]|uniref:AraC family transcriptional regulator n=1 Tax=Burkholderia sp. Ac-20353 TaxID=2703894 RepID=UPI00197B2688|nr:AraC family transcriptional regulator [Burkholderia sp. Ac-20353]MBN3786684.1 AraC family transcriptional regulator [Burkholderia sp. Ac-20353]
MQHNALSKPAKTQRCRDRSADPAHPATLSEKRFSPSKLAALIDVASESGLDLTAVLAGTGLDPDTIANPFTLTSTQQFLTAARNAIGQYAHSDLGVRVGSRLRASSYGMFGYALLCSESMEHGFNSAVKFHQLANGMLGIRWVRQDDFASWLFPAREEVSLPGLDTNLYDFLIDLQFALHVTVIKDAMGAWCVPARAQFMRTRPAHAALLADVLDCPLAFDQPGNVLSYPAAWLPRAGHLAHPITAAQVSSHCARLLDELRNQSDVTRRVYQELTRTPGRFPDIDAIAEGLCMTARTLRRKLEAAGTSYSELLTSVRKALAIDYLGTTALSIDDIAQALDFSDAVSFRHAFKRWTGKTPSEARDNRES